MLRLVLMVSRKRVVWTGRVGELVDWALARSMNSPPPKALWKRMWGGVP